MNKANVLIIDSRRFVSMSDAWYEYCVKELEKLNFSHSRITVPIATDLTKALAFFLDIVENPKNKLKTPDAFILLGYNYANEISEHEHYIMLESIERITIEKKINLSNVCIFETDALAISNAATKYLFKIKAAIQSIQNIFELKNIICNNQQLDLLKAS